jgi:hypothetical protein
MTIGARSEPLIPVSAESIPIAAATAQTPSAKTTATTQVGLRNRLSEYRIVLVEPRQTLRQICLRYLGRYNLRVGQQIQALNPGLDLDLNSIEIGQKIPVLLPPAPQNSTRPLQSEQEPILALAK